MRGIYSGNSFKQGGLVLAALVAAGCTPVRMAPPADVVGASTLMEATERSSFSGLLVNEGFTLGQYKVVDVNRDWNTTTSVSLGPWGKETKTTGFKYALQTARGKLSGVCSSEQKEQSLGILGGALSWGGTKIACRCERQGEQSDLLLTPDGRTLKFGKSEFKVTPINDLEGGGRTSETVGFRVDGDKSPLGAVDLVHPGRLWLNTKADAKEQDHAACAFVGLLLYKPPSDSK